MEGFDYDAAASAIKIDDITTDETNREILRKLKENDPEFDNLVVCSTRDEDDYRDDNEYCPQSAREMGWVGYYIGKNTTLQELYFNLNPFEDFSNSIELFCRGANSNRCIQKIGFNATDLFGGEYFRSLHPFFDNNNNISELRVSRCHFRAGCACQLSLMLRCFRSSIKSITPTTNRIWCEHEQMVKIIEA